MSERKEEIRRIGRHLALALSSREPSTRMWLRREASFLSAVLVLSFGVHRPCGRVKNKAPYWKRSRLRGPRILEKRLEHFWRSFLRSRRKKKQVSLVKLSKARCTISDYLIVPWRPCVHMYTLDLPIFGASGNDIRSGKVLRGMCLSHNCPLTNFNQIFKKLNQETKRIGNSRNLMNFGSAKNASATLRIEKS